MQKFACTELRFRNINYAFRFGIRLREWPLSSTFFILGKCHRLIVSCKGDLVLSHSRSNKFKLHTGDKLDL